jgi:hypothetical protein
MNISNSANNLILLFDEQGTPTFRPDREMDVFLGIAVLYSIFHEDHIFKSTKALFGLSNSKPLRNNRISGDRIDEISKLLYSLPVQLSIASVNLSDSQFQQSVKLHEKLGDQLRPRHRSVKGRPLAHIIHQFVLVECIFQSIWNYSGRTQRNSRFLIHIDDWSIPISDRNIYLEELSRLLEVNISRSIQNLDIQFQIKVPAISLLNKDSKRKRFIGVLASAISRSFMSQDDERYSDKPIRFINNCNINKHFDITGKTVNFLREYWDKSLRNPPEN